MVIDSMNKTAAISTVRNKRPVDFADPPMHSTILLSDTGCRMAAVNLYINAITKILIIGRVQITTITISPATPIEFLSNTPALRTVSAIPPKATPIPGNVSEAFKRRSFYFIYYRHY